jgi:hypothetical protein
LYHKKLLTRTVIALAIYVTTRETANRLIGKRNPKNPASTKKVEGSINTCPDIRATITPILIPNSCNLISRG